MCSSVFLMYHQISDEAQAAVYTITERVFSAQVSQIVDLGTPVLKVTEFATRDTAEQAIVITFDDGSISDLRTAAPILREKGLNATYFVTTGFVGEKRGYMTWRDVRELADLGMEIGAHGHSHRFLSDIPNNQMREEVFSSKKLLEDKTGYPVNSMSVPGGRYNRQVLAIAQEAGYQAVATSEPRINGQGEWARGVFGRVAITQNVSEREFRRIIMFERRYFRLQRTKYILKVVVKRLVGNSAYQRIWQRKMRA